MNPLRAGLVPDAESWPWSSVRAHLAGEDDELVRVKPLLEIAGNWKEFLDRTSEEEDVKKIRKHERTGRPLGGGNFVKRLESLLGRCLKPQKPGPKVKQY
jgi:putative transposase